MAGKYSRKHYQYTISQQKRIYKLKQQGGIKSIPKPRGLPLTPTGVNRVLLKQLALALSRQIKPRALREVHRPIRLLRQIRRLPQLGLRSQIHPYVGGVVKHQIIKHQLKTNIPERRLQWIPAPQSECHRRKERKAVLFATQIAGKNLKRSPGKGGSYRRTEQSLTTC